MEFPKDPYRSLDEKDKARVRSEFMAMLEAELVALEREEATGEDSQARTRRRSRKKVTLNEKDLHRMYLAANLEKEIGMLEKMFLELRMLLPEIALNWLLGEHELKLKQYLVKEFPKIYESLLEIAKKHRVTVIDSNTPRNSVRYGDLTIAHLETGRKGEAISVTRLHALLDKRQSSFIVGHTMQGGSAYKTYLDGRVEVAYNNFSLAKLIERPEQAYPDRQQGFQVVFKRRGGESFRIFEVPIVKGGFFWGNSEYRLKPRQARWERILVYGDTQFPFHDEIALQLVLALVKKEQPEHVVINGDLIDFPEISRFAKKPFVLLDPQALEALWRRHRALASRGEAPGHYELDPGIANGIEMARNHLKTLREIAPNATISITLGNHEWRFYNEILRNMPMVYGLKEITGDYSFDLGRLLGAQELNVSVVGTNPIQARIENYLPCGNNLVIGHFYTTRGKSGYTARAIVDTRGISVVQAHVQRGGTYYKTKPNGEMLVGCEGFCVASNDVPYAIAPNFQHGCVMIHKRVDGDRFYIQPLLIYRGRLFYGSSVYKVRTK